MDVCSIFPEVLFLINKPIFVFFFSLFQFVKKFNFLLKIPVTIFVGFFFLFGFLVVFGHTAAYAATEPGIRAEPQLQQRWIPNPLCWVRDQTCIPVLPRGCRSCYATVGTPPKVHYYIIQTKDLGNKRFWESYWFG